MAAVFTVEMLGELTKERTTCLHGAHRVEGCDNSFIRLLVCRLPA